MDLKVNEGLLFDDLMQVDNMFDFLSPKIVDFMNRPYPVETIANDIEVTPRQVKYIRM